MAAKAPKLHEKPLLVRNGFKFTDMKKVEFTVGKQIGSGGFGRIYEGTQASTNRKVAIKMEPKDNGPLFTEMHVYQKILTEKQLNDWKKAKDIGFLGLPSLISFGMIDYDGGHLRYLIIPKYNDSITAAFERSETCFSLSQVVQISECILRAYEYLHSEKYVHADVKAENLLMENIDDFSRVVLIDFGLAKRFADPIEKEDKKMAHNGTLKFTSCDAHRGCLPSFRGDLEILTHNMLYWLTGSLPWEKVEKPVSVFAAKKQFVENAEAELPKLVKSKKAMSVLRFFYKVVNKMTYNDGIDFNGFFKALNKAK